MLRKFVKGRLLSFRFAFDGVHDILKTEQNAWVHAICTALAIVFGLWLGLSHVEFILVIIVITAVWVTEAVNTVFEIVIDIVSPEFNESARRAKDVAAAAVLFAAIGAFITGMILFIPPLLDKFGML